MAKIDATQSKYTDFLPACVKCKHYRPNALFDPFDTETTCAEYGEIPTGYRLMSEACPKLDVESGKELIDVGERPLTMIERWAIDDVQLGAIPPTK